MTKSADTRSKMSVAQQRRAERNRCPACGRRGSFVAYATGTWCRFCGHGTPPPDSTLPAKRGTEER